MIHTKYRSFQAYRITLTFKTRMAIFPFTLEVLWINLTSIGVFIPNKIASILIMVRLISMAMAATQTIMSQINVHFSGIMKMRTSMLWICVAFAKTLSIKSIKLRNKSPIMVKFIQKRLFSKMLNGTNNCAHSQELMTGHLIRSEMHPIGLLL